MKKTFRTKSGYCQSCGGGSYYDCDCDDVLKSETRVHHSNLKIGDLYNLAGVIAKYVGRKDGIFSFRPTTTDYGIFTPDIDGCISIAQIESVVKH